MLDDTRTYLSEVWGNRWFDNRKLETRRDARNFAIPQFKNWRKVERNGARMMKPGRHPLPCVYKASWPAPRALASIFAPPNFAFLECKFYRNERIARNEGGCSDDRLGPGPTASPSGSDQSERKNSRKAPPFLSPLE